MATRLPAPHTKIQALTTNYLANDFEIKGATYIYVKLDDAAKAFTIRMQVAGGDAIEEPQVAAASFGMPLGKGDTWLLNVKAAVGTPNAQIWTVG